MGDTVREHLMQTFRNFRDKYLKAADGLVFKFTKDPSGSGKYGYLNSNGDFVPFKTAHTEIATYTAGTSASTKDMGEDHKYRYVSINPTPSQAKSVTASRSDQTVTPDSGYLLSSVTVNKYPDASGTFGTITSNGTHDMGATNNYRYVGVNVNTTPSVIAAGGVSNSNQISVVNGGYYFVQIFEGDYYSITFYVDGGTIINRSGKHTSADGGKGGASELFYIKATSSTLLIHDGDHKVSGIYTTNYMRVK
jgi:hypothetical protein